MTGVGNTEREHHIEALAVNTHASRWWTRELKMLKAYPQNAAARWLDGERREVDYAAGKVSIGHATVASIASETCGELRAASQHLRETTLGSPMSMQRCSTRVYTFAC